MRMLFLTTRFPFPVVGGEIIRPFYFLKYLSLYWKITVLSFSESRVSESTLKNFPLAGVRVHTLTLPRFKSYVQCLGGFFSRSPLEHSYYADKKMHKLIQQEIQSGGYNLVFCHLVRMAPYAENIKGIKKVLDICDNLSLRYGMSSGYRKGPFKFIEWLESKRLATYEAKAANKFDLNLIASSVDKDYLKGKIDVSRLEVIENGGIDTEINETAENKKVNPYKIVFFGNLRTFHNVEAVKYFYAQIFPLVKEKLQHVKFVIVGAQVPPCILKMRRDNAVSVFEDVPDIRPFIEDACVSVAPMRISVGIQNKILQSMSYGVPVVTTTLGLGGIRARHKQEILVADDPEEFARNVIMLIQDVDLRNYIIENAYALIKEQYLWPNICERLNKRLIGLIEE